MFEILGFSLKHIEDRTIDFPLGLALLLIAGAVFTLFIISLKRK